MVTFPEPLPQRPFELLTYDGFYSSCRLDRGERNRVAPTRSFRQEKPRSQVAAPASCRSWEQMRKISIPPADFSNRHPAFPEYREQSIGPPLRYRGRIV